MGDVHSLFTVRSLAAARFASSLATVALTLVCVVAAQADAAGRPAAVAPPRFVERPGELEFSGHMIVRPLQQEDLLARGLSAAQADEQRESARRALEGLVVRYYPEVDEYIVRLPAGEDENAFAERLMDTGDFEYVHPDWICYPVIVPNDPFYNNQWHHPRIQSPQAWNITTGSDQITCAFVDTGIDLDHPDLAAHRVPGYNSVADRAEVDGGDVSDINGHGTAVSGTAAAIGNNGIGVAGVGWNQRIMMIRTTNSADGGAGLSNIQEGARWAAEHGARIASASYSGVEAGSVNTTGRYIRLNYDAILCWAAGNSNTDLAEFDHEYVVVCGATDSNDNKASFSSYGRAVDAFAPGVNIWTTRNGDTYGGVSGTSFSTPMTNGVLSMIWSINPAFTADQVELMLFYTCDDRGAPGNDDYWGWGRVNVFQGVQLATEVNTGNVAPIAEDDSDVGYSVDTVRLDVTVNDIDFDLDALHVSAVDATSAQGGGLTISVGTGPNGRDEVLYTAAAGYVGPDSFGYTVSDGSLTDTAAVTLDVQDSSAFFDPIDPGATDAGLSVAYYALSDPTVLPDFDTLTPYLTGVVSRINYGWGTGNFAGSGRATDVGAVFTGLLIVPRTDLYRLYLKSDDGSRAYVHDQLVVNHDGVHGYSERSGEIGLRGGAHPIRIEYFQADGSRGLVASISSGHLNKQVIPASMFSHSAPSDCPADLDGDGTVALGDLAILLANFGSPGTPEQGDLNGDGVVGLEDLAEMLAAFGTTC